MIARRDGALWWLDRDAAAALGRQHASRYASALPYPHAVIDGLLGDELSREIADAFPPASHAGWKRRDYAEQAGRMGQLQRTGFADIAAPLRIVLSELNGLAFMDFLGALTGRRDLVGDPHFTGAGPMATVPDGHLAVHVDFNRDSARHLARVLSVLYYVPAQWDEAWGGELELWDRTCTRCETRIAPLRDRLIVMAYGEDHWHGHPEALRCPEGHMRAVVAAHYYAAKPDPDADKAAHGAIWARRP